MSRIILFSGTSEGRQLSEALERAGVEHLVCVATSTGAEVMEHGMFARVHEGRLDAQQMKDLVQAEKAQILADATHPYADVVSRTIRECAQQLHIPYLRVLRKSAQADPVDMGHVHFYEDVQSCRSALLETEGNILLTTGSKQLSFFTEEQDLAERLYARVLPTAQSLQLCEQAGIGVKHVIAMFGPFSEEMNAAMLAQYRIRVMVTKESGDAGGFTEKVRAASKAGCEVFVIGRPSEEEGVSWQEAAEMLVKSDAVRGITEESSETTGLHAEGAEKQLHSLEISLVGIGMGNEDTLTVGGKKAIGKADMILGAERMIEPFRKQYPGKQFVCEYLAGRILDAIRERSQQTEPGHKLRAAVLYSGDTGFYSGAATLHKVLDPWALGCDFPVSVKQYAGISSFSYLSAALGTGYAGAALQTWHGHSDDPFYERSLVKNVREHEQCYLLLSGVKDVQRLGRVLLEEGLDQCRVFLGYQLGSEEEKILSLSPQEASGLEQEGLYIAMIRNPQPGEEPIVKVLRDEDFMRDRTPMTKEEIRHLSILKLELTPSSVMYDIGAGTGSVSCEAARLHPGIRVYAIEQKETAVQILQKNIAQLHCGNVTVAEGKAPQALEELPAPTHAFIGGSSGALKDILELLRRKTPGIRVVVNAISLETLGEILRCAKELEFTPEMVQIQASRSHEVGAYHLVKAENPIWIAAFRL